MNLSKTNQVGKYGKKNKKARVPKKYEDKTSQQKRAYWKKKCLALWSNVVRERDNHRCQKCGNKGTEAHHIIPRGTALKMAWFAFDNGVTLCANCHKFRGFHCVDIDIQIESREWVIRWLRSRDLDYYQMKLIYSARGKMTLNDLVNLHDELKKFRKLPEV